MVNQTVQFVHLTTESINFSTSTVWLLIHSIMCTKCCIGVTTYLLHVSLCQQKLKVSVS